MEETAQKDIHDIKENFVVLIKQIKGHDEEKKLLMDFFETYDGTQIEGLSALSCLLIIWAMKLNELEIKGEAYDKLREGNDDFNASFAKLKFDYERATKGQAPLEPPEISQ